MEISAPSPDPAPSPGPAPSPDPAPSPGRDPGPGHHSHLGRGPKAPAADQLFARLQPQLWRILTTNLQVSEATLEDACQTAWYLLLILRGSIAAGAELAWLYTTATRYALKLQRAELDTEALDEGAQLYELARYRPLPAGPEHAVEIQQRLAEITELPVRQRRLLWLQGIGYEYREIAAATGESRRTVERQLLRARKRLAEQALPSAAEGFGG